MANVRFQLYPHFTPTPQPSLQDQGYDDQLIRWSEMEESIRQNSLRPIADLDLRDHEVGDYLRFLLETRALTKDEVARINHVISRAGSVADLFLDLATGHVLRVSPEDPYED